MAPSIRNTLGAAACTILFALAPAQAQSPEADVAERAKAKYSGSMVIAEDLMRFSIARDGVTYRMP